VVIAVVATSFVAVGSHPPAVAANGPAVPAVLPAPAAPAVPRSHVAPPAPVAVSTHGDLVVGAGQTFTIHPNPGSGYFYEGGNITVLAGGTLNVRNTTLSFVEYVADAGTPLSRLSHIYHFTDAGTVNLYNSTVTTEVQALPNAYAKLAVTVSGAMNLWNSSLAFPGWVTVSGAAATLTLNDSAVTWNTAVQDLNEPAVIQGDTEWAPSLLVSDGATLNVFGSLLNNTYADNTLQNGNPSPAPLNVTDATLASGTNFTNLATPTDSANLTRDWLYPDGILSGTLGVFYNNSFATASTVGVTVWYAGVGYPLGSLTIENLTSLGAAELPFTPALTAAINAAGMLNYLNYTGDFGVGPSRIAVQVTSVTGPAVTVNQLYLQLNSTLDYNVEVSGVGTHVNAVDAQMDLTFASLPTSPLASSPPYPWFSNKLVLTDGATANLGNLSVLNPIPGVFSTSAVLPDSSSVAYFYRWAAFNLTGLGGVLPIQGGTVSAYYSFDTNQTNNATANSLNDLATSNPAMWSYVQFWDLKHGVPAYATSSFNGTAYALLASGELTGTALPDGIFLGGYHIHIVVPAQTANNRSFNWSVSPYPSGVAAGSPNYGLPDYGPGVNFPSYFVGVRVSTAVTADAVVSPNGSVRIGQTLGAEITLHDTGTARVFSVESYLYWNGSTSHPLALDHQVLPVNLVTPGQNYTYNLTWVVNDTITGLAGKAFAHEFAVAIIYNDNLTKYGGANVSATLNTTIDPSQVHLGNLTEPPTTLDLSGQYFTDAQLAYNGSHAATVTIVATPTNGQPAATVFVGPENAGNITMFWFGLGQILSAGTTYTLNVTATYNGVAYTAPIPGFYSVPANPPSAVGFLYQKFLGLPVWAWLAIAGAVVAAILAFLFLARRQAAGKLVECGECGNLIPEEATVCPKCGAEFEADLMRCSRCASTIPADSKFCPECAAQLLGKPGEGEADPERQGYDDFTQKYRAEGKKELGDNYNEGSFWDWWKRQPTYTSFSQWKLQQGQGTPRAGMTAPPPGAASPPPPRSPPKSGGGAAAMPGDAGETTAPPPPGSSAAPSTAPPPSSGALKACPNCGKEIPSEYLICPFCSAVTQ